MSFAKYAAEAIANDEADDEREAKRSRWMDYLKALGIAGGVAAAGYGAYKAWPWMKEQVNAAAGTPVRPSLAERNFGAGGGLIGAATGVFGSPLLKMLGNHPSDSVAGIHKALGNAQPDSPLSNAAREANTIMASKKDLPAGVKPAGMTDIKGAIGKSMAPGANTEKTDPLVNLRNLGAVLENPKSQGVQNLANPSLRKPWNVFGKVKDYASSIGDLRHINRGLDELGSIPHGYSQPGDSPYGHQQLHEQLAQRFGSEVGSPGVLRDRLNTLQNASGSKIGPIGRAAGRGILGGALGAGADLLGTGAVDDVRGWLGQ
jgi:hypothetical protein